MDKIKGEQDTPTYKSTASYVLFAYALRSEETKAMKTKMRKLGKEPDAVEKKYEAFVDSKTRSTYSHGVGIGKERSEVDNTVNAYIYDNGLPVRHEYSVDKIAERIAYPFSVYVFDIEV